MVMNKGLCVGILIVLVLGTVSPAVSALAAGDKNDELLEAIMDGDIERAKSLIDAGADVNARDIDGWTPLMYAALNGHTEIVELLIESGADVNAKGALRGTALLLAAAKGETIRARGPQQPQSKARPYCLQQLRVRLR